MAAHWIQIVGAKDTGKTSLIDALTRGLVARGHTVAYIKHTHVEPSLESEDTDTARIRAAGARATVLASKDATIVCRSQSSAVDELSFREALPGDIVLAEGFKRTPGKKIVLAGGDLDIMSLEGVVAVIGASPPGYKGPTFRADQTPELCSLIEKLLKQPDDSQWSTRLMVNGEEIPMNAFVQDVTAATIEGITRVMRDVPEADTIELRARRIRGLKAEAR
jgi:molybdopterin-guanine dinucleotide biosynthesis protein MobB